MFFPVIEAELKQQANYIVDLCRSLLNSKFIRCDYKELAELTVLYLTGDLQDGDFKFKRPGALHKARWMSKLLYSIKMVILSEEISKQSNNKSKRVFQKGQLKKIKDFVKFSIFNYVPWWFASSKVAEAPYNDILLINSMLNYAQINVICSSAALKGLSKHLWYLTEELAPLILFSDVVDDGTKQKVAEKLLTMDKQFFTLRHGNGHGMPDLPEMPTESVADMTQFIGASSWYFFKAIDCTENFLSKPVGEWMQDSGFKEAKETVDNMAVVNDSAERGVKLCHDFLDSARNEARLQNVLQVVENDRASNLNQRFKHQKEEKRWFLKLNENE